MLVVDDEKEICFLLSNIVKKLGFDVHSAYSMSEGRKLLEKKNYKLIFLDLSLPDGLGFNLIPYIKRLNTDCKVVVITAFEGYKERQRAKIEGAHYFISKPFNTETILKTLLDFDLVRIT